jgi:hypothetical protein
MSTEKKSEIKINVSLDENNIPVKMNWSATEAGMDNQECKSMMLSVWDGKAVWDREISQRC